MAGVHNVGLAMMLSAGSASNPSSRVDQELLYYHARSLHRTANWDPVSGIGARPTSCQQLAQHPTRQQRQWYEPGHIEEKQRQVEA